MNQIIRMAGEYPLSLEERRTLRCLVGLMIPASARYAVPGADDDLIFTDILNTLRPQASRVTQALVQLAEMTPGVFADLDRAQQQETAQAFRKCRSSGLLAMVNATVQCYYRDDRVMRSFEMEARPPFPDGFEVEQGDWSLLDPVRARTRLYREPPAS